MGKTHGFFLLYTGSCFGFKLHVRILCLLTASGVKLGHFCKLYCPRLAVYGKTRLKLSFILSSRGIRDEEDVERK